MQFYDALGLAPKLALDSEALKKQFYERSRQWHPDRFGRASAAEQEKSLEMTSVLNDAFRTLRDPIARAEYFLEQKAIVPSKHVPPELLEEVFEMNLALEELRAGDESARPQLSQARERFHHMRDEIDHGLAVLFGRYDQGHDASHLLAIRSVLDRRQYIANLIRDVEKELNVHVSN
ncbi:MAG: Fe-S protein assembly co-chaperone HscB [Acidobacteriota bacterium]|nr:Fe-S protein assembly co-chaperone HscB [Acidobacteriota bacterium]